jgi:glycosyltransferase involved in cell wall biosynthesis
MKIVWLCHFSNKKVQEILKPSKKVAETAPWISALISLFEEVPNVELHIVSPHKYIGSNRQFILSGIHYHFFNAHIPFLGRHWPGFFKIDYLTDFYLSKVKVRKIINMINPDLIHLHGAENAYYSSTILQFKDIYPVLVTIQGFVSHASSQDNLQVKKCINVEEEILRSLSHFGYRTQEMKKDILSFNPKAKLHWHFYPTKEITPVEIEKKHDVVFFANISKDKGIEDLLKAISIVKHDIVNVSVCVIGAATTAYLNFLREMANQLGISDNIHWVGYLNSNIDVLKIASSSRISVLPTWHDIIPGTIIESMFLKLPVVAYSVGGIPEINDDGEFISLVTKGDINGLAEKILRLLKNPELIKSQGEKAYYRAREFFDNTKIPNELLIAYKEVINDFKK